MNLDRSLEAIVEPAEDVPTDRFVPDVSTGSFEAGEEANREVGDFSSVLPIAVANPTCPTRESVADGILDFMLTTGTAILEAVVGFGSSV